MTVESFGPGIIGGVVLVDPETGHPYRAVPNSTVTGISSWNDLLDKPDTFPPTIGGTGATAVAGNDARLSDARTPTDGSVTNAKVSGAAAISLDKTADSATRLALSSAQSTKLNDLPTAASLAASLAGKASSTHGHAISEVTGLQTALDGKQASGSYATATHTHAATDIASGSLDIARIPTGNTGTTVALGNHTHSPASIGAATSTHTHAIADTTNLQTTLDGKASTSHTHAASAIASGTVDIARLPVGTTGTTVAAGNHSHSDLVANTAVLTQAASVSGALGANLGLAFVWPYANASAASVRPAVPTACQIIIIGGTINDTDPAWMGTNDFRVAATS